MTLLEWTERRGTDVECLIAQRCHSDRSGFEGPWSVTPTKFSTQYFKVGYPPSTFNYLQQLAFHSSYSRPWRELTPSFLLLLSLSAFSSRADGAFCFPHSNSPAYALVLTPCLGSE